jgi:cation transport ATPase
MEDAAKKTEGVKNASVNFVMQKMSVEFEDGADVNAVMKQVLKNCKKVESDCEIEI